MKLKKLALVVASSLLLSNVQAGAGIPVFDSAQWTHFTLEIDQWAEQAARFKKEMDNFKAQYDSLNGAHRGMSNVANDFASRNYLPKDFNKVIQQGVGTWESIYNAQKLLQENYLNTDSDMYKASEAEMKQVAINTAMAREAYNAASNRFAEIEKLIQKIEDTPDQKDILDLQARIDAENVMIANEANKLMAIQMNMEAQNKLRRNQKKRKRMNFYHHPGNFPDGMVGSKHRQAN